MINIITEIREKRLELKLTQIDIAVKMKTTASAIARLEAGGGKRKHSPSLRTLQKVADAVNCVLEIKLIEKNKNGN